MRPSAGRGGSLIRWSEEGNAQRTGMTVLDHALPGRRAVIEDEREYRRNPADAVEQEHRAAVGQVPHGAGNGGGAVEDGLRPLQRSLSPRLPALACAAGLRV